MTTQKLPTLTVTMREFRAAPAKLLRRAARTGANLRLGEFLLAVRDRREESASSELYGAMSSLGRLVGAPSGLLSADDAWSTDDE